MKKSNSPPPPEANLPLSKQTAGGVAGAIVGGVIAGPVGAVAGAIAGTIMGNRAAEGKTLVSSSTVQIGKDTIQAVKQKLPTPKPLPGAPKSVSTPHASAKPVTRKRVSAPKRAKVVASRNKMRRNKKQGGT